TNEFSHDPLAIAVTLAALSVCMIYFCCCHSLLNVRTTTNRAKNSHTYMLYCFSSISALQGNIMYCSLNIAPLPQSEASVYKFSIEPFLHSTSSSRRRPLQFGSSSNHHFMSSLHCLLIFIFPELLLLFFVLFISV